MLINVTLRPEGNWAHCTCARIPRAPIRKIASAVKGFVERTITIADRWLLLMMIETKKDVVLLLLPDPKWPLMILLLPSGSKAEESGGNNLGEQADVFVLKWKYC